MKWSFKLVLIFCLSIVNTAYAIPKNGGISFSSSNSNLYTWNPELNLLDFANANAEVDSVSGDFVNYIGLNDIATFSDFYYDNSFTSDTIWAVSGVSFVLNTIDFVLELDTDGILVLKGQGEVEFNGQSSFALWNFTTNTAQGTFSWSSSTSAIAVETPVSSVFLLVAVSLMGLIGLRKPVV